MKVFSAATFVALLMAIVVRGNSDEVDRGSETEDSGDDLSNELLLQQLKWTMYLMTGKWPNESSRSKSFTDNVIHLGQAEVEPNMDTSWYDSYMSKNLAEKYQQNKYKTSDGALQEQRENSPIMIGDRDEIGFIHVYNSKLNYNSKEVDEKEFIERVTDSSLDQIFDFLLGLVSEEIIAKGKDQIPVPDMSEEFEKRVGFVKLHGKFDAQNGWFKNLSTIQRTGDVVATRRGSDTLVITCELGLATMQFGFQSYQANLAGLSVRGQMTGSVASNSVTLQVAATFEEGKCNITLEQLTMDRFDGLDVHLTGLGDMSWLLDSIVGWATEHFKDDIVSSIEQNLSKSVTDIITKYHCSKLADFQEELSEKDGRPHVSVVAV